MPRSASGRCSVGGIRETDRIFRIPALRLAERQSLHQERTYQYLFTWQSPTPGLGACHGIDIPFVFGTAGSEKSAFFSGSGPEPKALSERTMDAWLAFARSGDPNHPGLERWPGYEPKRRATMQLGATCELVEDPGGAEREAWKGLL